MSQSVPDDQEDLAEDQEMWCARWQRLLSQVHTSFQCMKEHGVDTALEADLLICMQEANALLRWWLGAAAIRKQQEEECAETVAQAVKAALTWAAKAASSDEEEDKEDKIIEVVALKLLKAQVSSKTITHHPPCDLCQQGRRMCTRMLGHTCNACIQLKTKCGKLKGKGGKPKKDTVPGLGPKIKGKEKGHLRLGKSPTPKHALIALSFQVEAKVPDFFEFSLLPELDSNQNDDDAMPRKRVKTSDLATHTAIETMKLALLTMRTKMHRMLGFLTELQAHAKVAKTYIVSQQLELKETEVLLEQL
ncbi:hypothetical protein HD554DRAFT_2043375 [Boletus coccyginus]|nr:hypothetical protein HD554DRAFT_2043375 [Boletus coccyginus]